MTGVRIQSGFQKSIYAFFKLNLVLNQIQDSIPEFWKIWDKETVNW